MGFFSLKRAELPDTNYQDENTVVRVLRSRFYGKGKGKERDIDGDSGSNSTSTTPFTSPHTLYRENPSFPATTARRSSKDSHRVGASTSSLYVRQEESFQEPNGQRSSADALTITLAQRLNELASANSEGLLSDDEYRLLRQSLFERFTTGSPVPTETPLVPISGRIAADGRTSFSFTHDRRPSKFHVPSSRTSSLQSKRSITSTVTSLLRRATSRRVVSMPSSDVVSVFSMASSAEPNSATSHILSNQSSASSLRPDRSRIQSLYPPTGDSPNRSQNLAKSSRPSFSRSRARSGSSAPPSAFPGPLMSLDTSASHLGLLDSLSNDDDLETSQEIRIRIEVVEAEGRRMLDTFNGLELSTLTGRSKRPRMKPPIPLSHLRDTSSAKSSDRRSMRTGQELDAMSFTSGGSIRTTHSIRRSPSGGGRITTMASNATLVSHHKSVSRKGSMSSVSSRGRTGPVGLSSLSSPFGLASSSSVNLTKSAGHLPLETVAEAESPPLGHRVSVTEDSGLTRTSGNDTLAPSAAMLGSGAGRARTEDDEIRAIEVELVEIRRRRAEVTARYEARLEYLRARLKGAELREKVLRK